MKFPTGFMIGAATAAHQVEGNNVNSDMWAIEQMPGSMFNEPSLDCTDHYNRFREDIDLMADAELNAYRFLIEWARIQPRPGLFDKSETEHYRQVLEYCHEKNLAPIVTLHHFSSPKWLIEAGGWEDERTVAAFAAYCAYIASELGGLMEYVCTINEANMGIQMAKVINEMAARMQPEVQVGVRLNIDEIMKQQMGALSEIFGGIAPEKVAYFLSGRSEFGDKLIMRAHEAARDALKQVCPHLKVGLTLSLYDYQPQPGGEENTYKEQEDDFLHYLPYLRQDDFLGIQNYSRKRLGPKGSLGPPTGAETTEMGYEFYPKALANVIRFAYGHLCKPMIITENGVATMDDNRRVAFIDEALSGVRSCIDEGIPVLEYMYWSLLDNFEWQLGFSRHFGLIAIDRKTQRRMPKKSLYHLGCFSNDGNVKTESVPQD